MDFERLLNHAKKNTEKSSKEMAITKNELSEKKTRELRRIQEEMERKKLEQRRKQQEAELALQRKQEEAKKQYQIPKVKKPQESTVSKDQILAFKAKKEEERIKTEKMRLKEKEKLAELRLEANGGRANKKIARHFGIDAINMQIRYGKDHEHIEKLQKRREKEQEEQDMLVDSLRGGVYKAMQQKKMVESSATKNPPSGSRPVGTSKANSLAGMSSRHASNKDRFSPPRNGKKAEPEKKPEKPIVKRPSAPPIDFNQLMAIASGKAKPPPISEKTPSTSKISTESGSGSKNLPQSHNNGHRYSEEIKKRPDHPDKSQNRKTIDHVPMKKPKMDHIDRREEVKPKTSINGNLTKPMKDVGKSNHQNGTKASASALSSPPLEPVIVSANKRYLPGDLRYKPDQEPFKAPQRPATSSMASQKPKHESKHHDVSTKKAAPMEKQRPKEKSSEPPRHDRDRHPAPMKRPEMSDRNERHKMEIKRRQAELDRERQYRYENMSLLERERMREAERRRASMGYGRDDVDEWEDELEDEDEYDSEMDDFIDDSMVDDDRTTRKELEETMRHINKNYDKNLWRKREQMIDERSMEANYKQIDMEERRSRRLGLMEDVLEAKKGNSMAL